jgi:hypothetical protein
LLRSVSRDRELSGGVRVWGACGFVGKEIYRGMGSRHAKRYEARVDRDRRALPGVRKRARHTQISSAIVVLIQIDALPIGCSIITLIPAVIAAAHAPRRAYSRLVVRAFLVTTAIGTLRLCLGY